jgi:hypothetical protein
MGHRSGCAPGATAASLRTHLDGPAGMASLDRGVGFPSHSCGALAGWGVGIIVLQPDDPEVANRPTAADLALESGAQVEQFLNTQDR